jgi:hypothetical protein
MSRCCRNVQQRVPCRGVDRMCWGGGPWAVVAAMYCKESRDPQVEGSAELSACQCGGSGGAVHWVHVGVRFQGRLWPRIGRRWERLLECACAVSWLHGLWGVD